MSRISVDASSESIEDGDGDLVVAGFFSRLAEGVASAVDLLEGFLSLPVASLDDPAVFELFVLGFSNPLPRSSTLGSTGAFDA
jgi:hypothetical protein